MSLPGGVSYEVGVDPATDVSDEVSVAHMLYGS